MPVSPFVQMVIEKRVAAADIKVLGTDLLKNDPEALLLTAVTKASGNE